MIKLLAVFEYTPHVCIALALVGITIGDEDMTRMSLNCAAGWVCGRHIRGLLGFIVAVAVVVPINLLMLVRW